MIETTPFKSKTTRRGISALLRRPQSGRLGQGAKLLAGYGVEPHEHISRARVRYRVDSMCPYETAKHMDSMCPYEIR